MGNDSVERNAFDSELLCRQWVFRFSTESRGTETNLTRQGTVRLNISRQPYYRVAQRARIASAYIFLML